MIHLGDQTKMLSIYPAGDEPDHSTADLLPTRAGDYGFHLFGTIGETEVDKIFTSADGDFSIIEPASDLQFLVLEQVDIAALQAQIDELRAQIAALSGE